ncbi:BEL1-like homeodomain protein [Seminavis robusta]|uniref:BEL1-like homeodomain protein n=1 Tax=Seminavis robusta TaxID=568900 RepID=A0A9N8HF75_9STRA|nr:BEL1-like homeodomain protein [Seminavis robusta]|eukprot:Sro443_g144010.1 BEL1-like homeodomain protein (378) ;mRNA; r:19279-20499
MSSPCSSSKASPPQKKKKSNSLSHETVDYLKAWMMSPEHIAHPYPTEQEKQQIMADTGIELKQLTNWFVNNRKRYWKPRVEARLQQQVQLPVAAGATMSLIRRKSSLSISSGSQPQLAAAVTAAQSVVEVKALQPPTALPRLGTTLTTVAPELKFARSVSRERLATSSPAASFLKSSADDQLQVVVSDASSSESCSSETGSVYSSSGNEDELANFDSNEEVAASEGGSVARTETVDVHILHPLNGVKPTIADVSILSTVPRERILCTYENVMLTYRFNVDCIQDRKKVQNRRDAEIVRLKRKYLKLFLDEGGMTATPNAPIKRARQEGETTPRKKFRRESLELWREACVAAQDIYDHDLPTLEEATLLFGFSRGISA